ncbi:MAG TPA: pyrimidine/purine nucleosidase domain-containing protein, partial [Xanthomonadaceae bacterium]|nr:pyrimidine/purine nucleosidase domain-containing protein [Xanthomonadaceae bacterium]
MPTVDTHIYPTRGGLDVLSRQEVARLRDASAGGMHDLLRRCALAVLTSGTASDDPRAAQEMYPDFDIQVEQHDRGLRLDLHKAPAMAFVDGQVIRGVAELLFAVVRDLAYTAIELEQGNTDLSSS